MPARSSQFSSQANSEVDKTSRVTHRDTHLSGAERNTTPGPSSRVEQVHGSLLSRLRILTANLPISVPIGRQDEPLGCFAVNPKDLLQPGQDAWEDVIENLLVKYNLFIHLLLPIKSEFLFLGGEGGNQRLNRKYRPCVSNSIGEDSLIAAAELVACGIDTCTRASLRVGASARGSALCARP